MPLLAAARKCCAWCCRPVRGRAKFCDHLCRQQWTERGGPNVIQWAERAAAVAKQPRGYATIEAFLEAGGRVYRGP